MTENVEAIILGIVQGLTEFLPVSSSGHLELGKYILGDNSLPEDSLMMTIVLHAATALSTIIVFRKDIWEIISGLFQFKNNEAFQFSLKVILSMIPAVVIGLFFEDQISALFDQRILLVGVLLIVTAILLLLADKAKTTEKEVSYKQSFIIGVAQAIAILPGISRSGATISTSVLLKIDREKAARFSFIMVIPLILGKVIMDVLQGDFAVESAAVQPLAFGFFAALFTGILACQWMIKLVKAAKLYYFSIYCAIVAIIAILAAVGVF